MNATHRKKHNATGYRNNDHNNNGATKANRNGTGLDKDKPPNRTGKTGGTRVTKRNPVNKAYRQERVTQVLTHLNNRDINLYQTRGKTF